MNALRSPWVVGLSRVAIGLVFLAAARPKIADPAAFPPQVHHYRLTPFGLENLLAITLPWVELMAALAILLGVPSSSARATRAPIVPNPAIPTFT